MMSWALLDVAMEIAEPTPATTGMMARSTKRASNKSTFTISQAGPPTKRAAPCPLTEAGVALTPQTRRATGSAVWSLT